MKRKNNLPIKWMLGAIVVLMIMAHGANHVSRTGMHPGPGAHNGFFQFFLDMFGMDDNSQTSSSSGASNKNNMQNGKDRNSTEMGGFNSANQQYLDSTSANYRSRSLEGNNAGNNPNDSSVADAGNDTDDLSDLNAAGDLSLNADQGTGNIPGGGPGDNSGGNSGGGPGDNPGGNSGGGPGDNPGGNSGGGPGDNPGGNSGGGPGDNPGGNPGSGPGNNPGNGIQNNLPTINPIPSDDEVAQSVAKQNQQNDALNALLSSRQALVAPVQQQAQAAKYQSITSSSIPTPSTDQPPPDVKAKAMAHQFTLH